MKPKLLWADRLAAGAAMAAALALGGGSLALLGVFLLWGPLRWLDLDLAVVPALALDGFLAALFALQHSVMVRRWFQDHVAAAVPGYLRPAAYAVASGVTLLFMVVLWQPALPRLLVVEGVFYWLLRGLLLAAGAIFLWGVHSLRSLDALGLEPILAQLQERIPNSQPLAIRGPYRWVRHPLYLSALLVLWSEPDLSGDRLMLNLLWTVWVIVATRLEERDLVVTFGDAYRDYRREVGMLVPRTLHGYRPPHRSG